MKTLLVVTTLAIASTVRADAIDEFVQAELTRQHIPGVAIGIFKNGQVLRAQGYGLANLEHQVPVKPETIFQTASIGKMFTAAAAMLLVEDGKLTLDAPITRYLPDAPPHWRRITVRHLLTHTSGMGDPYQKIDMVKDYSDDELLKLIYAAKPQFKPGQRWDYSNAGYITAGIIVSRVGGRHYSEQLQDRVFKPGGMTTARLLSHIDIVPNRAGGYERKDGQYKNQDWVSVSLNATGDGSLQMSVLDMAHWDAVVAERSILSADSWRQVLAPAKLGNGTHYPYGFGWMLPAADADAPKYMRHSGGWQGFRSEYRRYDEDGVSFIVLANAAHADPEDILQGIAQRFDTRYRRERLESKTLADQHQKLTAAVNQALEAMRSGKASALDATHPDMPAERRKRHRASMRKVLDEAGQCQPLVLRREQPNGDLLSRTYQAQCEKRDLRVEVTVNQAGRIVQGWLSPVDD